MIVRQATKGDVHHIVNLVIEAQRKSVFKGIKPSKDRIEKFLSFSINNPDVGIVFVLERDGHLFGALVGSLSPFTFSSQRHITDLFFYVQDAAEGHGVKLFRRFMKWATSKKDAKIIVLFVGYQIEGWERLAKLYELHGFSPSGQIFTKVMP